MKDYIEKTAVIDLAALLGLGLLAGAGGMYAAPKLNEALARGYRGGREAMNKGFDWLGQRGAKNMQKYYAALGKKSPIVEAQEALLKDVNAQIKGQGLHGMKVNMDKFYPGKASVKLPEHLLKPQSISEKLGRSITKHPGLWALGAGGAGLAGLLSYLKGKEDVFERRPPVGGQYMPYPPRYY